MSDASIQAFMMTARDATQATADRIHALKSSLSEIELLVNRIYELKKKIESNDRMLSIVSQAIAFTITPTPAYWMKSSEVEAYEFGPDQRIRETIVEFLEAENSQLQVMLCELLDETETHPLEIETVI